MISAKRSLKVDLPFDDYCAYFCTYAFQPSPNAYWDGDLPSPVTLGPNPCLDPLSPLLHWILLFAAPRKKVAY